MICVYSPDCTDFSTNGNGVLTPLTAQVTETLNGEYELQLTHPIDEAGKWQRLVEGCVLRAPVPASMTPRVEMISQAASTGRMIYKITTQSSNLRLRSGTGTKYKILSSYKKHQSRDDHDQSCFIRLWQDARPVQQYRHQYAGGADQFRH